MQYGGGQINWEAERAKPSDLRQWAAMQQQWSRERAAPALPLWTRQQLQAAGTPMAQQMPYEQALQQFRAASAGMNVVNPTAQQYQQASQAYDQARLNMTTAANSPWQGGMMSPQQRSEMDGNRNFQNMQNQAAAQQAFYAQGPMTAQRVQQINNDPFYAQRFQQTYMQTPQMRYGGVPTAPGRGGAMGYVAPGDMATMNRTTW